MEKLRHTGLIGDIDRIFGGTMKFGAESGDRRSSRSRPEGAARAAPSFCWRRMGCPAAYAARLSKGFARTMQGVLADAQPYVVSRP